MKKKKLKPNRNNIESYLPVFRGFYGSYWDEPDFYGEAEHFGLPANFPFWEYIDWEAYKDELSKDFCNVIESEMSDFIERVEFQRLKSPKYYNFENDSIYCIIRPKKKAISEYIYAHRPTFEKYLEAHLKSRDGFMSFHSYHFEDWEADTKKFTKLDNKGLTLGLVLDFIAEDMDPDGFIYDRFYEVETRFSEFYTKEFYDFIETLGGISEFVTEEAKQVVQNGYEKLSNLREQVQQAQEFVHRKYNEPNLLDVVKRQFKDYEYLNFEAIVDDIIVSTGAHTVEIQFK